MCGIAGIIAPNARNYHLEIKSMTNAIAHRGPDADHHEFYDNAALGHRRLSIIDLSETGKQPMFSNTKNECIVLNGEIYGYLDLKNNYKNYPYKGSSDTEVILAMYQQKGADLIHELPGMFAYAIWDEEKQELFCARDRFGEKPFYYCQGKNGEFIFASEIKAILASGLITPKLNQEALAHYLQYGYVNTYHSIYENIKTLPPAHRLHYKNGEISINRYYKIPEKDLAPISLSEAKEEFLHLLKKAVQKQLIADVKVGSFLSGGLDSSSVVALVSENLSHQTTISFGYDAENSELKFAKEIAEKYHSNHIEILETKKDLASQMLQISPFFDEPFADMSYLPHFEICKAARQNLTVVLSGDAGDELFGGYHFYRVENEMKNHFSYQNKIAQFGLNLYQKLRPTSWVTQQNMKYDSILDFHQNNIRNYTSKEQRTQLGLTKDFQQGYSFTADDNNLNDIMRTDIEKYIPGNMLVKSDRMAMANSLEVRTPFLDTDFAEFCIQLPDQLKIDSQNDKIILRETMKNYWTDSIRNRGKQGFGNDVKTWLKTPSVEALTAEILKNKNHSLFSIIDFKATQNMLDYSKSHWNLLQLGLWAQNNSKYW